MIARSIPNTFVAVTGFPNINKETAITNILFEALATAYVKGVTKDRTLNAIIFCNQFRIPSKNSNVNTV